MNGKMAIAESEIPSRAPAARAATGRAVGGGTRRTSKKDHRPDHEFERDRIDRDGRVARQQLSADCHRNQCGCPTRPTLTGIQECEERERKKREDPDLKRRLHFREDPAVESEDDTPEGRPRPVHAEPPEEQSSENTADRNVDEQICLSGDPKRQREIKEETRVVDAIVDLPRDAHPATDERVPQGQFAGVNSPHQVIGPRVEEEEEIAEKRSALRNETRAEDRESGDRRDREGQGGTQGVILDLLG